jgi:hypothetical protein
MIWDLRKRKAIYTIPAHTNLISYVKFHGKYMTGSIRDDPYWTSRKNSLDLIELSSIDKVGLVSLFIYQ